MKEELSVVPAEVKSEIAEVEVVASQPAKTMYLWEQTPEGKKRFRYELDADMVVIKKVEEPIFEGNTPDHFVKDPTQPNQLPPGVVQAQLADLDKRKIGYELQGDKVVITHIPERETRIISFFNFEAPCFFDGCEELRTAYQGELNKLEESEDCTSKDKKTCAQATLMRKYRDKIDTVLSSNGE